MVIKVSRRKMLLGGLIAAVYCPKILAREPISVDADEYSEELRKSIEPHSVPYAADFRSGDESLLYIATVHENHRSSRTFQLVDEGFREFRPRSLIVEGFPFGWGWSPTRVENKIRITSDNADLYQGDENLYACSVAVRSNIPFAGGEPAETDVTSQLEALSFRRLDIFGADVLRFLPQSKRSGGYPDGGTPTLDDVVKIVKDRSLGAPDDPHPNTDDFRTWYLEVFGRPPDSDPELLSRAYPSKDNRVGSVLLREAQIRDRYALGVIRDSLRTSKRVMVVYGGGHLVTQWRALTDAMGRPIIKA